MATATARAAKRKTAPKIVGTRIIPNANDPKRINMNALGVRGLLSKQAAARVDPASRPGANPAVTLPNATTAVTPVAPPPDPFLTTSDIANQALEYGDWGKYLSGVDLQLANLQTETTQKLGDVDRSEGENLNAADWNAAARGLQASSIKDSNKANISTQAESVRGATKQNLGNLKAYSAGEHGRWEGDIRPKLDAKWAGVAAENARLAAAGGYQGDTTTPEGQDTAPGTTPGTLGYATSAEGSVTGQQATTGVTYRPTVKNGKFYHVYAPGTASERWVYIRPAS